MKVFNLLLLSCLVMNVRAQQNDTIRKTAPTEHVAFSAGASWAGWAFDAKGLHANADFHGTPVSAYGLSWRKSGKRFEISMELGQHRRYGIGIKSQSYREGSQRHDLSMTCRFRNDYVELAAMPGFHTQGKWQWHLLAGAGISVLASTLSHTQSSIATTSTSHTGEIYIYPVETLPEYETSKKMVNSFVMARGHLVSGFRYQTETRWSYVLQLRLSADLSSSGARSEFPVFYSEQERIVAAGLFGGVSFRFK